MKIWKLTMLLLALPVGGCDPISGVQTNIDLKTKLDVACIDRTIRTTPGVGEVSHRTDRNESTQILPYRGKVITALDAWEYGGDKGGTVQILDDGKVIAYFNGRMKMGEPLPKSDLDAFVPLMNRVNEALAQSCSLPLHEARIFRN